MRIGGIGGPAIAAMPRRQEGSREAGTRETGSRALVTVAVAAASADPLPRHQSAAFLAHLIATRMQAPQTRERRRAEPEQAIAAYAGMQAAMPAARFGRRG